jgi:hypothetical protein
MERMEPSKPQLFYITLMLEELSGAVQGNLCDGVNI